jgi:hypothetical protein
MYSALTALGRNLVLWLGELHYDEVMTLTLASLHWVYELVTAAVELCSPDATFYSRLEMWLFCTSVKLGL